MKKSMKIGALIATVAIIAAVPSVTAPRPVSPWRLVDYEYVDVQISGPSGYIEATGNFRTYNYIKDPGPPPKCDKIVIRISGSYEGGPYLHRLSVDFGALDTLALDFMTYSEITSNCDVKWFGATFDILEIWPLSTGEFSCDVTIMPHPWGAYGVGVWDFYPDGYYVFTFGAWYGGYVAAQLVEFAIYVK